MSDLWLPHAIALARELENEAQRLDVVQESLVNQLVWELSNMEFLSASDDFELLDRQDTLSTPQLASSTFGDYKDAAVEQNPPSGGSRSASGPSPLPAVVAHTKELVRGAAANTATHAEESAASLSFYDAPFPIHHHRHRETQQLRPGPPKRLVHLDQPTPRTPSPLPQRNRQEAEARRARRALQCIREERDAYVNAKARRAQELLKEGREAVRKSRERRMAEAMSTHSTWRSK